MKYFYGIVFWIEILVVMKNSSCYFKFVVTMQYRNEHYRQVLEPEHVVREVERKVVMEHVFCMYWDFSNHSFAYELHHVLLI